MFLINWETLLLQIHAPTGVYRTFAHCSGVIEPCILLASGFNSDPRSTTVNVALFTPEGLKYLFDLLAVRRQLCMATMWKHET